MTRRPQGPLILEVDSEALPEAPSPADAPPPDDPVPPAGEKALAMAAHGRGWGLGKLVLSLLAALLALALGVGLTEFVSLLFLRHPMLGWVGAGLLAALGALLLVVCLRELAALSRLGRIETLRLKAREAQETHSPAATDAVLSGLERLYARRTDLAWARERLSKAVDDTPDAPARLVLAEQMLMAPLDARAEAAVLRASRNVAAATAFIPLALVDVVAALASNLRMLREIAEIYGGRAGWLGSWRLMRAVAAHLVATGAVAVADDMIGPIVGGGVLAKLSRRFGEGAINGALTARVGVAAMDVCRPVPFDKTVRPNASGVLLRALSAWRQSDRTG